MKLHNHTRIDDKILERVLYTAAQAVGTTRTSKVEIKVTPSSWNLRGTVEKRWEYDVLKMFLRIPTTKQGSRFWDPATLAEKIYLISSHEWRHVRDCQENVKFGDFNRNRKNRPHEIRAYFSQDKAEKLAEEKGDIQESILALGKEIERIFKPYKKRG